jgi:CRISPR/Cas system-associated exonuclease Cas4 (RecB family)
MGEHSIDHLSASQINLYIQCGLKYRFQYVDRAPRPFKSSGLVFGSAIHSTIEWFHKQRKMGKQVSLEKLYKILESDWFCQRVEDEVRYREGEEEKKLILTAKEILGLYFNSPLDGVVDAEFPFRVPLVHHRSGKSLEVGLEGFIDLIEEGDIVTEFKTSARSMDPQNTGDILQLTIYSYAYKTLFGKEPKLLRVVNFVKTRTPKMVILETGREMKDYERLYYLAQEVLRGIRSGIFFPRQSFMCKDCEYEILCQQWEGNE